MTETEMRIAKLWSALQRRSLDERSTLPGRRHARQLNNEQIPRGVQPKCCVNGPAQIQPLGERESIVEWLQERSRMPADPVSGTSRDVAGGDRHSQSRGSQTDENRVSEANSFHR
jgi:hypothetical protein